MASIILHVKNGTQHIRKTPAEETWKIYVIINLVSLKSSTWKMLDKDRWRRPNMRIAVNSPTTFYCAALRNFSTKFTSSNRICLPSFGDFNIPRGRKRRFTVVNSLERLSVRLRSFESKGTNDNNFQSLSKQQRRRSKLHERFLITCKGFWEKSEANSSENW